MALLWVAALRLMTEYLQQVQALVDKEVASSRQAGQQTGRQGCSRQAG
jgi:hypothetical protein